MAEKQMLRLPDVKARTGYARSTLYFYVKIGLFPKPVKIGTRCVGWPADEINNLINARISGQDDAAIKQMVIAIESSRKVPGDLK